jgi:hypothetical protein
MLGVLRIQGLGLVRTYHPAGLAIGLGVAALESLEKHGRGHVLERHWWCGQPSPIYLAPGPVQSGQLKVAMRDQAACTHVTLLASLLNLLNLQSSLAGIANSDLC